MAPTQECLDGMVCVLSSEEFKKFEEHVGVEPCEACDGPRMLAEEKAVFEALEIGCERDQSEADLAYIEAWVDCRTKEGIPPTDDEIIAALERYVYDESTLLRRGL
jgi:hypothetical protein